MSSEVLQVKLLQTYFKVGIDRIAKAVDGVSFSLEAGKTLAIVGESGCGKSQTAYSVMKLVAENGFHPGGEVIYEGNNLLSFSDEKMRSVRGNDISMIFQEPMTSLNPLYTIGNQMAEPLQLHKGMDKLQARERSIELLSQVGMPDPHKRVDFYPHELSGGMKQRVMIAMALSCEPKILIADEPTTALDVTIQAQVLHLMKNLQQKTKMSILLITHDLGIVNQMADEIAIMYAGKIVERGDHLQIFKNMKHPYTRRLFQSIPRLEKKKFYLNTIPGIVPNATDYGQGCLFADRCTYKMDICSQEVSPEYSIEKGHWTKCHLFAEGSTHEYRKSESQQLLAERKPSDKELLHVENLKTHFPVKKGVLQRIVNYVRAVDEVSLHLKKGSTVALVGESGCGKTTVGESLLRLNNVAQGKVRFDGREIMEMSQKEFKPYRKYMQAVFQDPYGSLSPRMTIEEIIGEGLGVYQPELSLQQRRERVEKVLGEVGLSSSVIDRFPHEFSGGQRQRIAIARTLVLEPAFIMLDEPTSALDVSVQAQVLNLLKELQQKNSLTYLFITHNLAVVRYMADYVAVMYLGKIVEYATVEELFSDPKHPYTRSLIEAVPSLDEKVDFKPIEGDIPSPLNPPSGCYFHPRCPIYLGSENQDEKMKIKCREIYPDQQSFSDHLVNCFAAK